MTASGDPHPITRNNPGKRAALIILDMINCFDFDGADALEAEALASVPAINALRQQFQQSGQPIIYVNDNFGAWHSERSRLIERALQKDNPVVRSIMPADDDLFVLKPQFSGFYATCLPVLLPTLGVSRLVLTGVATDICVLFTAADAHMREYQLWVPADCVAAEGKDRSRWALDIMANAMSAQIATTSELSLHEWMADVDEDAC